MRVFIRALGPTGDSRIVSVGIDDISDTHLPRQARKEDGSPQADRLLVSSQSCPHNTRPITGDKKGGHEERTGGNP